MPHAWRTTKTGVFLSKNARSLFWKESDQNLKIE